MERKLRVWAAAYMAGGLLILPFASSATLIDFDTLGTTSGLVPNGYAGFNWTGFSYMNTAWYTANYAILGSGYLNGTVSGNNVAFTGLWGESGPVSSGSFSISSPTAFKLTSAQVTSAWYDGENVDHASLR